MVIFVFVVVVVDAVVVVVIVVVDPKILHIKFVQHMVSNS